MLYKAPRAGLNYIRRNTQTICSTSF